VPWQTAPVQGRRRRLLNIFTAGSVVLSGLAGSIAVAWALDGDPGGRVLHASLLSTLLAVAASAGASAQTALDRRHVGRRLRAAERRLAAAETTHRGVTEKRLRLERTVHEIEASAEDRRAELAALSEELAIASVTIAAETDEWRLTVTDGRVRPVPTGTAPIDSIPSAVAARLDLHAAAPETATPSIHRPSFTYKFHESIRASPEHHESGWMPGGFDDHRDEAGRRLAVEAGVSVPHRVVLDVPADEIPWSALPDRCAVKPHRGRRSMGVHLLQRTADSMWLDHSTGRRTTDAELFAHTQQVVSMGDTTGLYLVEELCEPHPQTIGSAGLPDTFSAFCFFDQPVVIVQRRHAGSIPPAQLGRRVWDAQWNDLGASLDPELVDPSIDPPTLRDEIVDALTCLARAARAPFACITVYETNRGVVYAKAARDRQPASTLRADLDMLLGLEWEIAAVRLQLADAVTPSPATNPAETGVPA
jgi:hypothetical protein